MPDNLDIPPITCNPNRMAQMNAYFGPGGAGNTLTVTPYSNNVGPGPTTVVGAFTASTYTGALSQQVTPGNAYLYPGDGLIHVSGGTILLEATNGVEQEMSVAFVGPATMAGTLTLTITAAGESGSPVTVTINVLTADSNNLLAQKALAACLATAGVAAFFNLSVINNVLFLQKKVAAANDATMNAALADGTATGVTAVPTATVVAAGVAPGSFVGGAVQGVFVTDSLGNYVGANSFPQLLSINAPGTGVEVDIDLVFGN